MPLVATAISTNLLWMEIGTSAVSLRAAAQAAFPSRVIRGFTVFAPTDVDSLLRIAGSASGILVAVNAEKLANGDPGLRQIANDNLAYPDGMGAVLALRRTGVSAHRIAGADLWLHLAARFYRDRSFYLIGGTQRVIEATAQKLRQRLPDIDLEYRNGYLSDEDVAALEDRLRQRQPWIVLVGMGSPRQERLMERLNHAHPALYMGVGGSFDVFVGAKPRAPGWLQRAGMEWAYQFVRTPQRLPRLPAYLKFAWLLAIGRT